MRNTIAGVSLVIASPIFALAYAMDPNQTILAGFASALCLAVGLSFFYFATLPDKNRTSPHPSPLPEGKGTDKNTNS